MVITVIPFGKLNKILTLSSFAKAVIIFMTHGDILSLPTIKLISALPLFPKFGGDSYTYPRF